MNGIGGNTYKVVYEFSDSNNNLISGNMVVAADNLADSLGFPQLATFQEGGQYSYIPSVLIPVQGMVKTVSSTRIEPNPENIGLQTS